MKIIFEEENFDSTVVKIRSAINLKFTREDVLGLHRRRQLLRELFGKIPPKSTTQFSSLQLESFKIIHDDIIKTLHVLENMVINHPISGSAIPRYYSAIRKWIKDQQANPRSLYNCM